MCLTRGIKHSSIRLRYLTKLMLWSLIRFWLANLQIHLQINVFSQSLRVSRKCTQLSISSLQKTISRLHISKLFCDDTLGSSFATCMSRDLITVVARSRFKIIHRLAMFSKELYIERMVLLFGRFFIVEAKYLWFNGAKNCHIINIFWWAKCYGNSTKHNWNVCCMYLLRLAFRPISF